MSYDAHNDPQHIAGVIFNSPGTGPVEGTTNANARVNIAAFIADLDLDRVISDDDFMGECDGRYRFRLALDERFVYVDVPGLPLDEVRYVKGPGQNIWHFPRLYVDGSSWVWCYALTMARDALTGAAA